MYTVKIRRVIIIFRDLCYPSPSFSLLLQRNVSEFALKDLGLAPPDEEEQSIATSPDLAPLSRLTNTSSPLTSSDYASLLRHCGRHKYEHDGRYVHVHIVEFSREQLTFLGNLVIQMYGKCGDLIDAYSTFEGLLKKNVFSWNIMISMYVDHGHGRKAIRVFQQMVNYSSIRPHQATFVSALSACAMEKSLVEGEWINEYAASCGLEFDSLVGTALINMYGKCGSLEGAEEVFSKLLEKDVVTWSAMVAMYAQNGLNNKAFQVFEQMQIVGISPNQVTYLAIIDACSGIAQIDTAARIHATLVKGKYQYDLMVGNAIINMYGKCGSLENARIMFNTLPKRNVVSWSSLIGAHAQLNHAKDALEVFWKMHQQEVEPDRITFINILDACASSADLAKGNVVHVYVIEKGYENDVIAGTSLVNLYAKCGKLVDAQFMFERMEIRNVVSWNAMISGYAQHGQSKSALKLYRRMCKDGILPTKVTFFAVLSACSFAGLMHDAQGYFDSMERDYGLIPEVIHYNCIIDLLGRAGMLEEGENLIKRMPCEPTPASWMTLLGACRVKHDVERAQRATEKVARLDPQNSAPFVMLSNIYASCGMWDEVMNVRKYIKERDLNFEDPTMTQLDCSRVI